MRIAFSVLLICFGFVNLSAQQKENKFEFITKRNAHKVKIIFQTKAFVQSAHKIKITESGVLVDNQIALGVANSIPQEEISAIKFFFDGKEVVVSKDMFANYYNPNFGKEYSRIKLSDDGKSVLAFMAGGDAAGGYQVFWTFRSDGKHSSFSEACSDCYFKDFITGFFNN